MAKRPKRLSLNDFRTANTTRRFCTLTLFLKGLCAEDRRVTIAAINDPTIQATAIVRVLQRLGYAHVDNVINRHRAGQCKECAASGLLKPKAQEKTDR